MNDGEGKVDEFLRVTKARPDEVPWRQPKFADAGVAPKCCFRWLICGPSHSGKSNMARWAVDHFYMDFFDRILLLSPTAEVDFQWKELPGLEKKDRRTDLDPEWLQSVLEKQGGMVKRMGRDKAPMALLIIDDAIASPQFMNSKEFLRLFISGRHQNVSTMLLSQSLMKVPRSVRLQSTHISLFPSKTSEVDRMYDEVGPRELTKKQFHDVVNHAVEKRPGDEYPFFHVDVAQPLNRRYRRNFTEMYEIEPSTAAPFSENSAKGNG